MRVGLSEPLLRQGFFIWRLSLILRPGWDTENADFGGCFIPL